MAKCKKCESKKEYEKCEDCGELIFPKDKKPWIYEPKDVREGMKDCLHENCSGCKNGTCSGVHMISCPCPKCSPRM